MDGDGDESSVAFFLLLLLLPSSFALHQIDWRCVCVCVCDRVMCSTPPPTHGGVCALSCVERGCGRVLGRCWGQRGTARGSGGWP